MLHNLIFFSFGEEFSGTLFGYKLMSLRSNVNVNFKFNLKIITKIECKRNLRRFGRWEQHGQLMWRTFWLPFTWLSCCRTWEFWNKKKQISKTEDNERDKIHFHPILSWLFNRLGRTKIDYVTRGGYVGLFAKKTRGRSSKTTQFTLDLRHISTFSHI